MKYKRTDWEIEAIAIVNRMFESYKIEAEEFNILLAAIKGRKKNEISIDLDN